MTNAVFWFVAWLLTTLLLLVALGIAGDSLLRNRKMLKTLDAMQMKLKETEAALKEVFGAKVKRAMEEK